MKRNIIITVLYFVLLFQIKAQTTAYDYTKVDCDGVTQNLYTILNQGKVVILLYEHQCPSCLTGANNIKTTINTYYPANTNIKVWYLDNGGNNCTTIKTWIANNTLIQGPAFQYSSDFSSPYGSAMPVIVIAAGSAHNIYMISLGPSNVTAIHDAIENALLNIGIKEYSVTLNSFSLFPNPVNALEFSLSFSSKLDQSIVMEIFNVEGKLVSPAIVGDVKTGENTIKTNVSELNNGIFFIKLQAEDGFAIKKILINR